MFLLYFGQTNAALVWHILKHYKILIIQILTGNLVNIKHYTINTHLHAYVWHAYSLTRVIIMN